MPPKNDALPFYRQILIDAWRLSISHRHLWVFGFFATFAGFGGVTDILFGLHDRLSGGLPAVVAGSGQSAWAILPGFATLHVILTTSPNPAVSLLIFGLATVVFFALFAWIVSTAVGALIGSIRKIERGGRPKLADGFRIGQSAALRVFVLNVTAKLIVAIAFLLAGATLLQQLRDKSVVAGFFYLLSFVICAALAVVVSLVSVYATNSAVIENLPVVPAVADGLRVLKRHWLVNIEMVIVLLLINAGLAVLALFAAMVLAVPLIFLFMFAALVKSMTMLTIITSVTAIALLAVIALIGSFATTFQVSCWTLLWIRLSGRGTHVPKVMRLVSWFQDKLRG
ncbi:MAG: hypothetical protein ABIJ46_00990 [bacterium]